MKNTTLRFCFGLALLPAAPMLGAAQVAPPAANTTTIGPPIQRIATASALSTEQLGSISSVRELPDGRVLVNDPTRRRLLLMDTTMRTVRVVLDSLSEVANTYGPRPGALIPYRGDTTLFVDPASFAIVVLDPEAKITRVRSVWRVEDVSYFTLPTAYGWPGVDAKGRVVYRIRARPAPPKVAPPAGVPYFPPDPDSAFIIAMNLDTRRADTLGVMRIPKTEMRARQMGEGGFFIEMVTNPLPSTDEWALLPDGTVAFVRGRDYRIEYLNPDGTLTSSEKLPFDWQRLNDADKERLVDSVKAVQQRQSTSQYITAMIRWVNQFNQRYPENFTIPQGFMLPPGMAKDWKLPPGATFPPNYVYACPPGVEPTMPTGEQRMMPPGAPPPGAPPAGAAPPGAAPGGAASVMPSCMPSPIMMTGGNTPPVPTPRPVTVIHPSDLPDYRPPIATGSVRADLEGNLWIRTIPMKPTPGGNVYDIVNRQGELVNRLQIPPGYTIVGFGKGKIVYLSMRDATGIHLARVRLR